MNPTFVKEISVHDLKRMRDNNEPHQLIDVRENDEYAFCNIGGKLIPLISIPNAANEIDDDKPVIIYCRSGARSAKAVLYLQQQHGLENLFNLQGGILAWASEIDSSIPKY